MKLERFLWIITLSFMSPFLSWVCIVRLHQMTVLVVKKRFRCRTHDITQVSNRPKRIHFVFSLNNIVVKHRCITPMPTTHNHLEFISRHYFCKQWNCMHTMGPCIPHIWNTVQSKHIQTCKKFFISLILIGA
jgi:hypothetical protein